MTTENDDDGEELTLDGQIPVLIGDNGKKLRMGLDHGLPQFYVVTPSKKGEWFMRIHPRQIPNGLTAGTYEGKSTDGKTRRMLTIVPQADGMTKVMEHPPESTSGRFVLVSSKLLPKAWEYTLKKFNGG